MTHRQGEWGERLALVIAGPTAAGKSGLALAVAEGEGGAIINADSMQVYLELRVLTARPSPAEEARVPHRLYGVLAGSERCSAARWRTLALAAMEEEAAAGRLPVLAGGTGLYLRALMEGLSPIPPVPAEIRREAMALHARLGGDAFRGRLALRDPAAAARLASGDSQRLVRAWEVVEATGRALSDWQREPAQGPEGWRFRTVLLMPPRDELDAAIGARFRRMMDEGAVEEVRALRALGLGHGGLPVGKAVGVREIARYLDGSASREQAAEEGRLATRRYAKRQLTWFRHQLRADLTLAGAGPAAERAVRALLTLAPVTV